MAKRKTKAADELDALYAAPLEGFTKERNAFAKELRGEGERERADEVKALKKPSLPAWAINQGVRADDKAVKGLLKAGDALRSAHERAVGGDADDLWVAMAQEADAVETMTMAVVRAARPEQLAGGMLDRVRDTLRAVAGDQELRQEFESGRVTRDRKPVGLGGGGGDKRSGGKRSRRKRGPTAAQRRKADALVTKARKALDTRRREIAEATKKAETARRAAKDADGRVAKAEDAAGRAQEALKAAETARDELKD